MKLPKLSLLFFLLFISLLAISIGQLQKLTIFQYMLGVQILPSILLALTIGRLSIHLKSGLAFLLILSSSLLFAFFLYHIMLMTPQELIEQNTSQSANAIFTFNREISTGTYIGFFLQTFLLSYFVRFISRLSKRLIQGMIHQ